MSIKLMSQVWGLDLSHSEKWVLMALADYANDDGYCFPNSGELSWKTDYSERSLRSIRAALMEKRLLEIHQEGGGRGRPHVYRVMPWNGRSKAPRNTEGVAVFKNHRDQRKEEKSAELSRENPANMAGFSGAKPGSHAPETRQPRAGNPAATRRPHLLMNHQEPSGTLGGKPPKSEERGGRLPLSSEERRRHLESLVVEAQ